MRQFAIAAATVLFSAGLALAAPLDLSAPPSETTDSTNRADTLTITRVLCLMHLTDQQVIQLARGLTNVVDARKRAEDAEGRALLRARTALARKLQVLLTPGATVPADLEKEISQALVSAAQARADLSKAESAAFAAFVDSLNTEQLLMVEWDLEGPKGAEVDSLLTAYRRQAEQTLDAMTQLLWPSLSLSLTLGARLYQDRRLALLENMVFALDSPDIARIYTPEEEQMRMDMIRVLDGWREEIFNRFGEDVPEGALMEVAPMVTIDLLHAMGIAVPTADPPPTLITEAELRRLLLRDETVRLITHRAELLQQAQRRTGAMGVPPYSPQQGPPPEIGPGGETDDWGPDEGYDPAARRRRGRG